MGRPTPKVPPLNLAVCQINPDFSYDINRVPDGFEGKLTLASMAMLDTRS